MIREPELDKQEKLNIKRISEEQLLEFLQKNGEKAFRAKQINDWVWKKSARSFAELKNIPKTLIQLLDEHFYLYALSAEETVTASDGTAKYGLVLEDGVVIECVLIPSRQRLTACISSQAGCPLKCVYCATGLHGYTRNLHADEMIDQVSFIQDRAAELYGRGITNVVLMGMGEPLLNYQQVMMAINHLITVNGMSPRRITLSTSGIAEKIKQLANDQVKFKLAISLHSANDEIRSKLMPINDKYNLGELAEAIRYFYEKTGTRVTYEYTLFKQVNDRLEDARSLAEFCKISPCKINLIPYNNVEQGYLKAASEKSLNEFAGFLEKCNLVVNIRTSKGASIRAACGQLAGKRNASSKMD